MKDEIQNYLESICKSQQWAKNQIKKEKVTVDKINTLSISSVKQKLK